MQEMDIECTKVEYPEVVCIEKGYVEQSIKSIFNTIVFMRMGEDELNVKDTMMRRSPGGADLFYPSTKNVEKETKSALAEKYKSVGKRKSFVVVIRLSYLTVMTTLSFFGLKKNTSTLLKDFELWRFDFKVTNSENSLSEFEKKNRAYLEAQKVIKYCIKKSLEIFDQNKKKIMEDSNFKFGIEFEFAKQ